MKKAFLFISLLFFACSIHAQDLFKKHGFERETLTLSKGRFEEIFTNKEVVQIGSVLLNTKTNKIIQFLDEEDETTLFKSEHSSRFMQIDPLAYKFPWQSPYVFCNNNPIKYIDPDGRVIKLFEYVAITGYPTDFKVGQVSAKTQQALVDIMKTEVGRAFFAEFAEAGQEIGGYTFTESGKYANHDLNIIDISLSQDKLDVIPLGIEEGTFSQEVSSDGKSLTTTVSVNSYKHADKYGIGETLAHETQLHGYKAGERIETFKKGGKATIESQKSTAKKDHDAFKDKNLNHSGYKSYNQLRKQLSQIDPNYEKKFKSTEEMYN